jgi:hypothetical protein
LKIKKGPRPSRKRSSIIILEEKTTVIKRRKSCNNDIFGGVVKMDLKRGLFEYRKEVPKKKKCKRKKSLAIIK